MMRVAFPPPVGRAEGLLLTKTGDRSVVDATQDGC
jgi:hypothetical protein